MLSQVLDLFVLQLVLPLEGMQIFSDLFDVWALEKTPHPNMQVSIPNLFILERSQWREGLIFCMAIRNLLKMISSDGVRVLV